MSKKNGKDSKFALWLKESMRKLAVSLKRKPSIIPGAFILIAFLLYSLNLTDVSNTTAKIQGSGMGLCGFCTMLFSILSFVCFLNAFPHRKKANIPMLILMFAMFAIIVFCDIKYRAGITNALARAENRIRVTSNTIYIADAFNMLGTHIALLCVSAGLVVLMPIYGKLLKKINTSVNVEDNDSMDEIELSEDE